MDNIFFKTDSNAKKTVLKKYKYMGAGFCMALMPEKSGFVEKRRQKRLMRSFDGAYAYNALPRQKFPETDNRICICENIYQLCRKIIKANPTALPGIGIADEKFTEDGARIVKNLGRLEAQIYVFTKSKTAHGYVDYMLSEFGAAVCVKSESEPVDILIEIRADGKIAVNVCGKYVSDIRLSAPNDDILAPCGIISDRLYDFLRLSGMRQTKKIKIVGYKLK